MQVDDEDDIDIGGSEEISVEIKSEVDNGKQNNSFETSRDTQGRQSHDQYTENVAPDYQESGWEPHQAIDTSDMDEKSKALIQQMLAEEEYYFGAGTNSLEHGDYIEPKPKKRKVQKRDPKANNVGDTNYKPKAQDSQGKHAISSAELPSHKTRWSAEEDEKLRKSLEQFGYGNWKAVAEAVGSRNALQCKNHARHLVNSAKITHSPETDAKMGYIREGESTRTASEHRDDDAILAHSGHKEDPSFPINELQNGNGNSGYVGSHVSNAPSGIEELQDVNTEEIEVDIDEIALTKPGAGNLSTSEDGQGESIVPATADMPGSDTIVSPTHSLTPLRKENLSDTISNIPMQVDREEIASESIPSPPPPDGSQKAIIMEEIAIENQHIATKEDGEKENHVSDTEHHSDAVSSILKCKGMTMISDIPRKVEDTIEEMVDAAEEEDVDQASQNPITNSNEKQFDPYHASDDEVNKNREWFLGKSSKTPERYLKIRNTILASWNRCKPRYLTKTSARNGLKDCGDVNAIGRVHTYLEDIGAINTNCITNPPRPKRSAVAHVEYYSDEDEQGAGQVPDWVMDYDGPRKRKVRDERGRWVDPKDLEGRVIEHGAKVEEAKARPKRTIRRPKHLDDDFRNGYDPFRLVPLEQYDQQPPFHVTIVSDALIVMDFHSYLAHTEIIGLLGGKFNADTRRLEVQCTFPCKSTSTGIQCEMDPESEMRAREVFAEKGMAVVGWYHSHPTFEPNPSVRDIENQSSYQSLFRHEETGLEPFIGVIVSPYDHAADTNKSKFQYLSIGRGWDTSGSFRMPYACVTEIQQCDQPAKDIYPQLQVLVEEYCDYEHRVDMAEPFPKDGTNTRLDKLLDSLSAHVVPDSIESAEFLDQVRELIVDKLPPPPPKGGDSGASLKNNEATTDAQERDPVTPILSSHDPNSHNPS